MLSKSYYANLANGRFSDTGQSDLEEAFNNFNVSKPASGWVIHFHGGLVDEKSAMMTAESLHKKYLDAGGYPFFFVWESGLWESFRNNLRDVSQETLFKKLVSYLVEYLLGKLGLDPSVLAAESTVPGTRPQEEVEKWIRRQEQQPAEQTPKAPYDGIRNEEARKDLTGSEVNEAELQTLMQDDAELQDEIARLNADLSRPALLGEVSESGLGYKTPGHLSPEALGELTGTSQPPSQLLGANEALGSITMYRVAVAAARVGYRVIRRYMGGRDHGLYTTVVEEVLRDLYIGSIGSSLFWNQMKRDTLDAFGEDETLFGGTAFLQMLDRQIKKMNDPPRITLIGHSAGAIFVCNFLLNAHRVLNTKVKFDVVLLAPAADFELFNQAIQTGRIANVRLFGMRDEVEARDALLAPYSETLKFVYPKSLLYLVSGLLEIEVDRPLVGMERYYPGEQYRGRLFSAVESVRRYLASESNRVVWSPQTSDAGGLGSLAARHGDFDQEDAATLDSVQYVITHGFEANAAPDVGEAAAPTPTVEQLAERIDELSEAEAIQTLERLSTWLENNSKPLMKTKITESLYPSLSSSIPVVVQSKPLSDGQLAKLTLHTAVQSEQCQRPLTEFVYAPSPVAEAPQKLSMDAVLRGLQTQVEIDESVDGINVSVSRPSYALSRSASELISRGMGEASPTSSLVIDEEQATSALATLSPEDLAIVYDRIRPENAPQIDENTMQQSAENLVHETLMRDGDLSKLLVEANLAVPSAGLLQRFLPADRKASRSLKERFSSTPEAPTSETAFAQPPVSTMTLRLRSPDISLDGVPGLQLISKVGRIAVARGTPETLQHLEQHDDVLTINGPSLPGTAECVRSMPRIRADVAKKAVAESGDRCLVAIIDGGIDPLHEAFRKVDDLTQTRLVGIWDMTDGTGPAPAGFEAAGGTWHSPNDINGYLAANKLGKQLKRDAKGHGTHVISIAAGTQPIDDDMRKKFPGGVAHEAPILVVIVGDSEYELGSPTHLGYSETHVSALEFCQRTAETLELPVVVNISQGQQAGGHDGTTLVEVAIDDFTEGGRKPGYAVVKSAGNDRDGMGHAFLTMGAGSQESLEWVSHVQKAWPKGRLRDIIEVWFEPSKEMGFLLVNPDGQTSEAVNFKNDRKSGPFPNGNTYSLEYTEGFRDNGHGRLRIEIGKGSASAIRDGKWQLEIVNAAQTQPQELHAWVERTDWQPIAFTNFPSVETTLTIPGTAKSVITVAAVDAGPAVRVARFSGYGRTRTNDEKPDIAAPGVGVNAAQSGTSFDFVPMDGTSMAAPHVTGAIALLFSACKKKEERLQTGALLPTANRIRSAFKKLCPTNKWDRGLGFGVLDVDALLRDFNLP